jgi:hypothetical protein
VQIEHLGEQEAYAIGELAKRCGHPDVVDLHVALCARRRRQHVVTTDVDDLRRIDPALSLIAL